MRWKMRTPTSLEVKMNGQASTGRRCSPPPSGTCKHTTMRRPFVLARMRQKELGDNKQPFGKVLQTLERSHAPGGVWDGSCLEHKCNSSVVKRGVTIWPAILHLVSFKKAKTVRVRLNVLLRFSLCPHKTAHDVHSNESRAGSYGHTLSPNHVLCLPFACETLVKGISLIRE